MNNTDRRSLESVLLRGQEAGVATLTGSECAYLTDLMSYEEDVTNFFTVLAIAEDEGLITAKFSKTVCKAMGIKQDQFNQILIKAQEHWAAKHAEEVS